MIACLQCSSTKHMHSGQTISWLLISLFVFVCFLKAIEMWYAAIGCVNVSRCAVSLVFEIYDHAAMHYVREIMQTFYPFIAYLCLPMLSCVVNVMTHILPRYMHCVDWTQQCKFLVFKSFQLLSSNLSNERWFV